MAATASVVRCNVRHAIWALGISGALTGCGATISRGTFFHEECPDLGPVAMDEEAVVPLNEVRAGRYVLVLRIERWQRQRRPVRGTMELRRPDAMPATLTGEASISVEPFPGIAFTTRPSEPGGVTSVDNVGPPRLSLGRLFETYGILLTPSGTNDSGFWGHMFALWWDSTARHERRAEGVFCATKAHTESTTSQ